MPPPLIPTAKIHSQIDAGQLTSGIAVIGNTASRLPIDVYSSWLSLNEIARLYLCVSAEERDFARPADIAKSMRAAGYYVAGVYCEKASDARIDRPELLRVIADLQPGKVVVAEKIDRLSRLPLAAAEQLVNSIRAKGAKLAAPVRPSDEPPS